MNAFVDARQLMDQQRHEAALAVIEGAIEGLERDGGEPIADLHFLAAETLVRLERPLEAEAQFLDELRLFPLNVRARAALAGLYQTTGRTDEAGQVLSDLIRIVPAPEAFAEAARSWAAFGNPRQAAAVRAEARRVLAAPSATAEGAAVHH